MSINLFDLFRGYIKNCGVGQMIHRFHSHFSESVLVVHGFISHRIHVWYISLHLVDFYGFHVGKYTSPMDPMGFLPYYLTGGQEWVHDANRSVIPVTFSSQRLLWWSFEDRYQL